MTRLSVSRCKFGLVANITVLKSSCPSNDNLSEGSRGHWTRDLQNDLYWLGQVGLVLLPILGASLLSAVCFNQCPSCEHLRLPLSGCPIRKKIKSRSTRKRPRRDTSLSLQDSLVYRPVLTVAVRPNILERQQCLHDERK